MAHAGASRGAGWGVLTLGGFPGSRASVPGSAAGGDLSLLSGGGQLGYALAVARRLELAPVVGAEVEWVHGSGSGVARPADGDLLLLSFAGGGRAALPLSAGWAMFGQGLLSGLVTRPRFVLEGLGELYQPPGWGFCFSLGAEWRPP